MDLQGIIHEFWRCTAEARQQVPPTDGCGWGLLAVVLDDHRLVTTTLKRWDTTSTMYIEWLGVNIDDYMGLKKQERRVGCLILEAKNNTTISIFRATLGCLGNQLSSAYPRTPPELSKTRFIGWLERFLVSYQRLSDQHLVHFAMVPVLGHCDRCSPNFGMRPG